MSSTSFSIARNGMSVAINSFTSIDLGNGYKTYNVTYTEKNLTTSSIDQVTLRLFFNNGEPAAQYGFFNSVLPGEAFATTKSYQFTVKSNLVPAYLEYDADHFFSQSPINGALLWNVSGDQLSLFTANIEPSGANNAITILEDSSYFFASKDFGFSDADGNGLGSVKISSLPGFGDLRYNESVITSSMIQAGYEVSATDIELGKLSYSPKSNENGILYSSFSFQVRDNGGTVLSGINLDQSANTISFDVTPINDEPKLVNKIPNQLISEDTPFQYTLSSNIFYDVDIGDKLIFSSILIDKAGGIIGSGILPSWLHFNETNKTFSGTPMNGDVGSIYLNILATDTAQTSQVTQFEITISNTNDDPIGTVTIAGITSLGQNLTVTNTLTDEDGLGLITYQWLRSGKIISGYNDQNYKITEQDVGQRLAVKVSYTDGFGTQESVLSGNSLPILPLPNVSPLSVDSRGNLVGSPGIDVFDGTQKPTAKLSGGQGNDSYLINITTAKIYEAAKHGIDSVFSSVTFTLPNNLENLTLIGDSNVDARGNKLDNLLTGNDHDNLLYGSAGNDVLIGYGGHDSFVFDAALNPKNNFDTIIDFNSGEDIIAFSAKVFKKLGTTVDSSDIWFKNTGNAQGKTDFLVYDSTSGVLAYDADGSGKKPAVQIALIGIDSAHPVLQLSDLIII